MKKDKTKKVVKIRKEGMKTKLHVMKTIAKQ